MTIRGRLYNSRAKGNGAFIVLRDQMTTIQCVGFVGDEATPNMTKDFVKFINSISKESIIDVVGELNEVQKMVESCTIKN